MPRRRYDTGSLVGDMKREKRHAILLSLLGLTILVFLVIYFARLRGPQVPEVPADTSQPAVAKAPTPPPAPPPPVAPVKPVPQDAAVEITLPKPGPVLIDGTIVVKKTKGYETRLTPGKHRVATKIGRKAVLVTVDVVAGKHYQVDLDPKKKKNAVEEN